MSARVEWFEVTTLGSRGAARVVPAALAPKGVQVEFEFATGRHLETVTASV